MAAVQSYANKIQRLVAEVIGSFEYGQSVYSRASSDYAGKLIGVALVNTKYMNPDEYAYHKLLNLSVFLKSYISIIEALDDLKIDLSLDEFEGEF